MTRIPIPHRGFIGFDGEGTSFSAQGLAADGITPGASVNAGGLAFAWPDVASAQPDNTMAEGQTIAVSGSGSVLGFLAAANNSPESGTGTIYYTDGTHADVHPRLSGTSGTRPGRTGTRLTRR